MPIIRATKYVNIKYVNTKYVNTKYVNTKYVNRRAARYNHVIIKMIKHIGSASHRMACRARFSHSCV